MNTVQLILNLAATIEDVALKCAGKDGSIRTCTGGVLVITLIELYVSAIGMG